MLDWQRAFLNLFKGHKVIWKNIFDTMLVDKEE